MSVPRPAHARFRIALAVIGAVAVLAIISIAVFVASLGRTYDTTRHVVDAFPPAADRPAAAPAPAGDAVNVLVLGTDRADPATAQLGGKRQADAVMVLHVTADRSKVYALSILRNSLVDVPGHGPTAINSAYAYGGVKLTVRTVEHLLGVRVDHVVDVSLEGLPALIDALGGVQVQIATPFTSGREEFRAGWQTLDGERALAYLQAGDVGASGDEARANAQEQVLRGVVQRVLSARVLLNPAAVATSITALSPYLTTDADLDSTALVGLGVSLRNLGGSDVVTLRTAARGERTVAGATVLDLDEPLLRSLSKSLQKDSLSTYPR